MVVVDKSTSDAVSCAEDVVYDGQETLSGTPRDAHPLIADLVQRSTQKKLELHPLEVLAVHLASAVEPGGIWIALSYSSDRFPFLKKHDEVAGLLDVGLFWEVERIEPVSTGAEKEEAATRTVYTPEVSNYLYILRRTNVIVAIE